MLSRLIHKFIRVVDALISNSPELVVGAVIGGMTGALGALVLWGVVGFAAVFFSINLFGETKEQTVQFAYWVGGIGTFLGAGELLSYCLDSIGMDIDEALKEPTNPIPEEGKTAGEYQPGVVSWAGTPYGRSKRFAAVLTFVAVILCVLAFVMPRIAS